ncbi:MAG TPA: glycoside hydrolase family 140 protein [Flavitalea sp.]|nr:glycoside hydrolase family 140 protein [Flavitalea sp.]
MISRAIILLSLCFIFLSTSAQLTVSADKHFLQYKNGKPFFWLGDTAWELFHRLNREEAMVYLKNRADKGFTVIQAVVLAELDGLNTPNPYGDKPLINNDPAKPNEAYFKHVDFIVNEAQKLGLTIGMLPSWGDKWNKAWGEGPEIFTPENAGTFGEYLGRRYRNKPIIWIMGGDRNIIDDEDKEIIRSMAKGLMKGDGHSHLFTFHPQGGKSSSDFFKDDDWIDFHMSQTGHAANSPNYTYNRKNLALTPLKPHLDGEPRYEDHPNKFKPAEFGWMDDFDTRQAAYWSMLTGALGHTYGNHNIWQMYSPDKKPVNGARTKWRVALDHPGSYQVGYMRQLLQTYPWYKLVPDQDLVKSDNPEDQNYRTAAIAKDSTFALIYIPYGQPILVNTVKLGRQLSAAWFNPRDNSTIPIEQFQNSGEKNFTPPSIGRGSDWVLILKNKP